ncbi:MAG: polysaccharide deacetylase family protein [Peptococcaceae bacterium]|nr:polysaccharide deacetylase family protein [Peptococcaceae bacterium]
MINRKGIFSCSISGILLIAIVANTIMAGVVTPAIPEPSVTLLRAGSVIYLPGEAQSSAQLVYQGQASGSAMRIAFTFDSGWIFEYTPALLDILRDQGVVATFFHRGKWAEANPELVTRIVAEGHLTGNHSYTHPDMSKLSLAQVAQEITLADIALEKLVGYKPWLYRPPYGLCTSTVRQVLAREGYTHSIMWTIDSHDWMDPGVQYIVDRVTKNAKDGAIVLMHVGAPQTIQALPAIIEWLKNKDYEFVLLDDLLPTIAPADGRRPYRVREGDTLESVALKFEIGIDSIVVLNPSLLPNP